MDNVYVDKVPTCCDECPCCNTDVDYGACCNLEAFDYKDCHQTLYKHPKCPLKSTSQLLLEERKKVVQEIRERLTKYTLTNDDFMFDTYYKVVDVEKVLDQIERGE